MDGTEMASKANAMFGRFRSRLSEGVGKALNPTKADSSTATEEIDELMRSPMEGDQEPLIMTPDETGYALRHANGIRAQRKLPAGTQRSLAEEINEAATSTPANTPILQPPTSPDLSVCEPELDAAKKDLEKVSQLLHDTKQELALARAKLDAKESDWESTKRVWSGKLDKLNSSLSAQATQMQKIKDDARKAQENLVTAHSKDEVDFDLLQKRLNTQVDSYNKAKSKLDNVQKDLLTAKSERNLAINSRETLEKKLAKEQAKFNKELAEVREDSKKAVAERDQLASELGAVSLNQETQDLKDRIQSLEKDVALAEGAKEKAETNLSAVQSAFPLDEHGRRLSMKDIMDKILALEQHIVARDLEIKTINAQRDGDGDNFEQMKTTYATKIKEANGRTQTAQFENVNLRSELKDKSDELATQGKHVLTLDKDYTLAERKLNESLQRETQLETKLQNEQKSKTNVAADLSTAEKEANDAQSKIVGLEGDISKLNQSLKDKEKAWRKEKSALESKITAAAFKSLLDIQQVPNRTTPSISSGSVAGPSGQQSTVMAGSMSRANSPIRPQINQVTVTPPNIVLSGANGIPVERSALAIDRELKGMMEQMQRNPVWNDRTDEKFKSRMYQINAQIEQHRLNISLDTQTGLHNTPGHYNKQQKIDKADNDSLTRLYASVVQILYADHPRQGEPEDGNQISGPGADGPAPRRSKRNAKKPARYRDGVGDDYPDRMSDSRRRRSSSRGNKRGKKKGGSRRRSSSSSGSGSGERRQRSSDPSSDPSSSSDSSDSSGGGSFGFGRYQPDRRRHNVVKAWYKRQEGSSFYKRLPKPWNVVPDKDHKQTASEIGRLISSTLLAPFGGAVRDYSGFRAQFIQLVHVANVDIATKCSALKACVKSAKLNMIIHADPGAKGYALLIKKLEDNYGGEERLLNHFHDTLRGIQKVHFDQLDEQEELVDTLEGYMIALPDGRHGEVKSHSFAVTMVDKLDSTLTSQYHQYCKRKRYKTQYQVQRLVKWLKTYPIHELKTSNGRSKHQVSRSRATVTKNKAVVDCPLCQTTAHSIVNCEKFKLKKPQTQKNLLKGFERCINCGSKEHFSPACEESPCKECKKNHLTQFHGLFNSGARPFNKKRTNFAAGDVIPSEEDICQVAGLPPTDLEEDSQNDEPDEDTNTLLRQSLSHRRCNIALKDDKVRRALKSFAGGRDRAYSLRFVTFRLINPTNGKSKQINAILDDGANLSTLDKAVADELELTGKSYQAEIEGFGSKISTYKTTLTQAVVESVNGRVRRKMLIETFPKPLGDLKMADWRYLSKGWEHMGSAFFNKPAGSGAVQMIFGTDATFFHRALQEKFSADPSCPVARLGPLGWTAIGQMTKPNSKQAKVAAMANVSFKSNVAVRGSHRRVFHQQINILPLDEVFKRPPILNAGDRKVANDVSSKTRSTSDGRIEAPVLWASSERPKDNMAAAAQMWEKQKHKLDMTPKLRSEYDEAFNKWLMAGYVKEISMDFTFLILQ